MRNYYVDDNSVFASRKIECGEPIGVAFVVSESEIKPHNFGEYLTHSDTPNCKIKRAGNFIRIDSVQNLREGTELTVNFNDLGMGDKVKYKDGDFNAVSTIEESAIEEAAGLDIIKTATDLLKSLPNNIFKLEGSKYSNFEDSKKEFKEGKTDKLTFARYELDKSTVTDEESASKLAKAIKKLESKLPEGLFIHTEGDEFKGVLSLSLKPKKSALKEGMVDEDSITDEDFDSSISNGLYTTDEIFEKSKNLPVHALLDDDQYRAWFEYYQRRSMKLESFNPEMEAYWYKTVTEALAAGDDDVVLAHGWEPTLPLTSSNLYTASIRLENAINNVEINEYNYCNRDFSCVLEEAEEKNLVPVYIMLTASPTPMGSAIRKATKSKVSHSALSFDPSLESMISFNMNGLIRESKSKYINQYGEDMSIAVYVVFVTPQQRSMMQSTCSDMIKNADKWKYNLKGLFGTLLNKPIGKGNVMFCSEFVDRVFKAAGIRLTDKKYSGTVTPDDFYKSKSKNVFKIFDGNIGDYKEETAKAKTVQYKQQSDVPLEHKKVDIVVDDKEKRTSKEKEEMVKEYFVEAIDEGYLSPLFSPNYILSQMVK